VTTRTAAKPSKSARNDGAHDRVALAAIGLESEFAVVVDGHPAKPEDVFGSPTRIVRAPMMHRIGRSYHLPTGGAVYFDTGVIEIATPVIEIRRGCAARAGRSLWESIRFLRGELDAWEERESRAIQLVGFSTHYNISLDPAAHGSERTVDALAVLLTHILAMPVMLLASNRRSTGIGVRPRANRIEVTADFTPDAAMMIAAATVIVGIAREVMTWDSFQLAALDSRGVPVVRDVVPEPHSSRSGWVARSTSFAENPFVADVNAPQWETRRGELLSIREIAGRVIRLFWPSIARLGDARSLRLIEAVIDGQAASFLELDDRPPAYDDVGRLCTWTNIFPVRALSRYRYERLFMCAIAGRRLRLNGDWYTPTGTRGWSRVVLQRERDRTRHVVSLDFLLDHLGDWGAQRRRPLRA